MPARSIVVSTMMGRQSAARFSKPQLLAIGPPRKQGTISALKNLDWHAVGLATMVSTTAQNKRTIHYSFSISAPQGVGVRPGGTIPYLWSKKH